MLKVRFCSVTGCSNYHYGIGFCKNHLRRFRKYGDPISGGTPHGDPILFLRVLVSTTESDCIVWPYSCDSYGYARVYFEKQLHRAHRLICRWAYGEPRHESMDAAHSCGKGHRGCVNPKHVRWATKKENQADRNEHGTDQRGEQNASAKLTERDVLEIRRLRTKKKLTCKQLGQRFSVDPSYISAIVRHKVWKHTEVPFRAGPRER